MALPDLTKVVPIYRAHIDNFINSLGKNIKVVFETTVENVSDGFNDPMRPNSIKKPDYKTTTDDGKPTTTENYKIIKGLIQYNPKDFVNFGVNIEDNNNVIRVKTFLADLQYLVRCQYIIPNFDSDDLLLQKFKLIRAPIPRGILHDYYAYTYWQG